ncbi:cellulose synthase, putative [Babesia ovata]|uniref:Cellulose synthase, putative n=1 Tax=Babesia ovata TaxID=189622 RepID=A0A2H6KIF2_9APIC|nr:cellulose synthase, putative [Babesia ovata]GBE62765.1 cellulose synthase, putative [Babesia ovata]
MDVFVQNLFNGIDIPDDISEIGKINNAAPKHENNATPDVNIHVQQQTPCQQTQTQDNANACQTQKRVPVITAGLSAVTHDGGFARPTKRPVFDVKAPFIAPKPCQTPSQPEAVPPKRPVEEPTKTKREETRTSSANSRKLQHTVKKTIAERFPLRGPAGIRSYRNLALRGIVQELCWEREARLGKGPCYARRKQKYADFPQHFSVSEYVTKKYNIKWIINEAAIRHVGFKMDWLVVFVLSQRTLGLQVMFAFMDKTGQMLGCMNEELHLKLKTLEPGCALILKNVSRNGEV